MYTFRFISLKYVLAACVVAVLSAVLPMKLAYADNYPSRPIKIVVPVSPGGGSDVTTRRVAEAMSKILGQTIVIDNRAGAAGIIASELVAKAPPDGYTLLAGTRTTATFNIALYKSLPYHPIDSYVPIGRMNSFPNVLVVSPSLGVNSIKELVELAKRSSRPLTFASGGTGTSTHLLGEIMKSLLRLSYFYYEESCGQCTPCREGTGWLYRMVHRIEHGQGRADDLDLLNSVCDGIQGRTICALGDAAAMPVRAMIKNFKDEFAYHIEHKRCLVPTYI